MAFDLIQAKAALATLVTGAYNETDLLRLVRQTDIVAGGAVTVLYSGEVGGVKTSVIADAMKIDPNLRVIDKTVASKLLSSDEFISALGRTKGLTLDQMKQSTFTSAAKTELFSWLFDGKAGPWADTSKRFVEATVGEVRILTTAPRVGSVLTETELPALLEKLRSSNAITKIDGLSRADLLKVGVSYSTNWVEAMRSTLLSTAATQSHLTQPLPSNYTTYLNATPEIISDLYKASKSNPSSINTLIGYVQNFEVPRAATRALSKLGLIGGIVSVALVSTQVAAAELRGNTEEAKTIAKEWAFDVASSTTGQVVAAAVAGVATAAALAVGLISAPVAGALVLIAALAGGYFGGETAKDYYVLLNDRDENGNIDLFDRLINVLLGVNSTTTTPLPADLDGQKYTINASLTREAMLAKAATDDNTGMAWRYALRELNPFVITDVSYERHNTDGSLDLYDEVKHPNGLTEQFLKDRASMLTWKLAFDKKDAKDDDDYIDPTSPFYVARSKPYNQKWDSYSVKGDWDFIDLSKTIAGGEPLKLSIDGLAFLEGTHQVVFGSSKSETITGSAIEDWLYGMDGIDTITAGKGDDYVEGNAGNDIIDGGEGNDRLIGGTGNDQLTGGKDSDILIGGEGNDELTAGTGNDVLYGGAGNDTLDGGDGNDFLSGGAGIDTLSGGDNNDYLVDQGGSDKTTLKGDGGNDILEVQGGSGITVMDGGAGNDILSGGAGTNSLDGGEGNDVITGGDALDIIKGGDGADVIDAGGGADLITGGAGADYMRGGAGVDQYSYDSADFGTDLIEDSTGTLVGKTGRDYYRNRSCSRYILKGCRAKDPVKHRQWLCDTL
jgi:hypothetical protein